MSKFQALIKVQTNSKTKTQTKTQNKIQNLAQTRLAIAFACLLFGLTACQSPSSEGDGLIHVETSLAYSLIGTPSPVAQGDPVSESEFGKLLAMTIDEEGYLYILDNLNYSISVVSPAGEQVSSHVFGVGEGPGEFQALSDISVVNSRLYLLDGRLNRVSVFNKNFEFLYQFQIQGRPTGILSDGSHLFLTKFSLSNEGNLIHRYSFEGEELDSFLPKPSNWRDIALTGNFGQLAKDKNANIYYSFPTPYIIFRHSSSGAVIDSLVFGETLQVEADKSPTGAVIPTQASRGLAIHPEGLVFNLVRTQTDVTIDVFDRQFKYVASLDSTTLGLSDFSLIKSDPNGALYLGTNSPVPHVKKYTISISNQKND